MFWFLIVVCILFIFYFAVQVEKVRLDYVAVTVLGYIYIHVIFKVYSGCVRVVLTFSTFKG